MIAAYDVVKIQRKKKADLRKGFNLVEAAIVLGVIGLVIGGIWVAASAATNKMRLNDAKRDIGMITKATQNLFRGQCVTDAQLLLGSTLHSIGAIQDNAFDATQPDYFRLPWDGVMVLPYLSEPDPTCAKQIIYEIFDTSKDVCIGLATGLSSSMQGELVEVEIAGDTNAVFTNRAVLPTEAADACDSSTNQNLVKLFFSL